MNKTTDSSLSERELLVFVKLVCQHYREARIKLTPEIVERMDEIVGEHTMSQQSNPATLREAVQDMMPLIEWYVKREIEHPANHQEFARQTEGKLQRLRAALAASGTEAAPTREEALFQAANTAAMNLATSMNLREHPESCECYGCGLQRAVVNFALARAKENVRPIVERELQAERPLAQAAASPEGEGREAITAEVELGATDTLVGRREPGDTRTTFQRVADEISRLRELVRQSAAPSGGATARLEERRARAKQSAENHKHRTGGGPGTSGYVNAYMCGYFNHPQWSSKALTTTIIEEFEATALAQESKTGAVTERRDGK